MPGRGAGRRRRYRRRGRRDDGRPPLRRPLPPYPAWRRTPGDAMLVEHWMHEGARRAPPCSPCTASAWARRASMPGRCSRRSGTPRLRRRAADPALSRRPHPARLALLRRSASPIQSGDLHEAVRRGDLRDPARAHLAARAHAGAGRPARSEPRRLPVGARPPAWSTTSTSSCRWCRRCASATSPGGSFPPAGARGRRAGLHPRRAARHVPRPFAARPIHCASSATAS